MKKFAFVFLVALGLGGVVTVFAATQSFNRNLYYGLTNDGDVQALQQFLTAQGDFNGPISGNFFSLTREAVIKFQENNSITPAVGYFGPLTRAVVNSILSQQASTTTQLQNTSTSSVAPVANTNPDLTFEMKAQCQSLGQARQEKEDAAWQDGGTLSGGTVEYGYSPSLNTCIYGRTYILYGVSSYGGRSDTPLLYSTQIWDLMTSNEIYASTTMPTDTAGDVDINVWQGNIVALWAEYDSLTQ